MIEQTHDQNAVKEALKRRRGQALDLTIVMGNPHEKTPAGAIQEDEHNEADDGELAPDVKDHSDSNVEEAVTEHRANQEMEGHDMDDSGDLKEAKGPGSLMSHDDVSKLLASGPMGSKSHMIHKGKMHKPMHK